MRGVLAANLVVDRKVYVADSFEGLPPPDVECYPQDTGDIHHAIAELSISLEQVQSNFARYDLLDNNLVFVKGFFRETLPHLDAGPFSLIRLDGDMYESTYIALECLYPKLSIGGFIIIDDYGAIEKCRQAVTNYRNEFGIEDPLNQVDWTAVWWRKSK